MYQSTDREYTWDMVGFESQWLKLIFLISQNKPNSFLVLSLRFDKRNKYLISVAAY